MDESDWSSSTRYFFFIVVGVHDIQTDVAAKSVIVEADTSVSPELMLEKLVKVSLEKFVPNLFLFLPHGVDNISLMIDCFCSLPTSVCVCVCATVESSKWEKCGIGPINAALDRIQDELTTFWAFKIENTEFVVLQRHRL
jgi:hypothetical protein